jgi:hypothetical protein
VVSAKVGQARNRLGIVHFPYTFASYGFEPISPNTKAPGQQADPPPRHPASSQATASSGSETGVSSFTVTCRSLTSVLPARRIFGKASGSLT